MGKSISITSALNWHNFWLVRAAPRFGFSTRSRFVLPGRLNQIPAGSFGGICTPLFIRLHVHVCVWVCVCTWRIEAVQDGFLQFPPDYCNYETNVHCIHSKQIGFGVERSAEHNSWWRVNWLRVRYHLVILTHASFKLILFMTGIIRKFGQGPKIKEEESRTILIGWWMWELRSWKDTI